MRLFIAASFPEAVIRDLDTVVKNVKSRLPPSSWVRPESQHLTFAFLGEQDDSIIDRIAPPLTNSLSDIPSITAELRGCGFFPNAHHARVGWMGVHPEEAFNGIAQVVREVVKRAGVELDGSSFKAHLTLMRLRDHWPPASIHLFESTFSKYRSAPFPVDSVTLYSSKLNPNGAVHTPLRHFKLTAGVPAT